MTYNVKKNLSLRQIKNYKKAGTNMEKSKEYYEIDLLQLLGVLWAKAWVIALAAVIGGCAVFSYAEFVITPKYQAEAMMYVNNSSISLGNTSVSISSAELTAAQSLVDTYIIILNSRTTLNEVISRANLDCDYKTLKSMLTTAPVNSTEVFSIGVTSEEPEEAERIANTIVEVLPDRISDIVDGSSVRVVDYAVVPSVKASPDVKKFTLIGILAGIAIACMAVIIQMLRDTVIHSEEYLIENYEIPVLAVIPDLSSGSGEGYYSIPSAELQTKDEKQNTKGGDA